MRLVFDIEANGLYQEADTIWCIVAKDIDTCERYEYHPDSKYTSPHNFVARIISNASELIGHNILNYDLPLIKKLLGWDYQNYDIKITDTLVMSRLANPDRPRPPGYTGKGGPHSLEAWGYRVGKGKPDHSDWHVFSPAMLRRCREDVEINHLTYSTVSSELEGFSDESIRLEHDIARIITDQEHHGIRFDRDRAQDYVDDLTRRIEKIDLEIIPLLPKELEVIGTTVTRPFKVNGEYAKKIEEYQREAYDGVGVVAGPFNRIKFNDFNIGSTEKIKQYLLSAGWQPDTWNFSKTTGERTSPKLEGDFRGIEGDVPKKVKERITWRHRRSQIQGWIDNARPTNTNGNNDLDSSGLFYILPAGANPCGTNTGRMRHHTIVNIPKANADKKTGELIWDTHEQKDIFGTQMRSLFIPREGFVIVGHDASGIELRLLAHYMNDKDFIYEVLNGDIHTYNQLKAGLPTRDDAKTFIYALIYGAGDGKIGSIVGGDATDGKNIKEDYFGAIPKLARFIKSVKRAAGQGYLRGLDGRKLWMRKGEDGRIQRSRAPNTLLQGAGAIINKKGCTILWENVKKEGLTAHKILDMHDEGQSEVLNDPKVIEPYCQLAVNSIVEAGKYYNLNIPLAAEYKIGMNMAETH